MELELTRAEGDRRLFLLDGIGSIRLTKFARSGAAEANGRRWTIGHRGFWRNVITATDDAGAEAGRFEPRLIRGGGTLVWQGRELLLESASVWRSGYRLTEDGRELAALDGPGWGRRPVSVTLIGGTIDDHEPILFATYVFLSSLSAE